MIYKRGVIRKLSLYIVYPLLLSACSTAPLMTVASATTCVTEVATKGSKFSCEIEGEKVFAKK